MTGLSSSQSPHASMSLRTALTAAVALLSTASAHSWNEQLSVIGPGGIYSENGYPRGYVARTDPGYNGNSMDYLLPPLSSGRTRINPSDLLCHPSQRTPNQPAKYPRLKVAPGSAVAMKYLENGHVTLPLNQLGKPPKAGTVFVFGTNQPKADEKLTEVLKWTRDGTGGDGRGILIAANNFDDDRCHQINSGAISVKRQQEYPDPTTGQPGTKNELWCETDIVLPKNIPVGKAYTVYWVWQWPTLPHRDPGIPDGKDEYYTTCSDLDVVAQAPAGPPRNTLTQQDPMKHAPANYLNRSALKDSPIARQHNAAAVKPSKAEAAAPTSTGSKLSTPEGNGAVAFAAVPQQQQQQQQGNVMHAVITVTATMPPGQSIYVVEGRHVVTFTASPTPAPLTPRATRSGKQRIETHADDGRFPGIE